MTDEGLKSRINIIPPVLFIIFNRPDTTQVVFNAIRNAQPKYLFIAADGPRMDKPGEKELCEKARQIAARVDWPCEVATLFRKENLGCKSAIASALDWFFQSAPEGIILEDDCVPDASFFPFCGRMLEHYREVTEVKIVSGTNYLFGKFDERNSFYFSNFMPIWGWATWRRAWREVSFDAIDLELFKHNRVLEKRFKNKGFADWLYSMLDSAFSSKLDAWSPYLVYAFASNNGVGISPYRNLISNIGYQGSHVGEIKNTHPSFDMPTKSLNMFDLKIPAGILIDRKTDAITFRAILKIDGKKNLLQRGLQKVFRLLKKWFKR